MPCRRGRSAAVGLEFDAIRVVSFLAATRARKHGRHGRGGSMGVQRLVTSASSPTGLRIKCLSVHRPRGSPAHLLPSSRAVTAQRKHPRLAALASFPLAYLSSLPSSPSFLYTPTSSSLHPLCLWSSQTPATLRPPLSPWRSLVKAVLQCFPCCLPSPAPSSSLLEA